MSRVARKIIELSCFVSFAMVLIGAEAVGAAEKHPWGASKNTVFRAQIMLEELKLNPGPIDGIPGAKTQAAIRSFQKRAGLQVNPVITDSLIDHLKKALRTQWSKALEMHPAPEDQVCMNTNRFPRFLRLAAAKLWRAASFILPEGSSLSKTQETTVVRVEGEDVLQVVVFEEPDLSKDSLHVGSDGFITFPLIGRVRVRGLTAKQIEHEITRLLKKDYLVNPRVSVQLKEQAPRQLKVAETPST